jgi:glycosyltransferase involved in cell wall biosynthesis
MSRLLGRAHDELAAAGHEVEYLTADDVGRLAGGRAGRLLFPIAVRRAAVVAARAGRPFDVINVHEPHGALVATRRNGFGRAAVVAMTHGVEQRGWEVALAHSGTRPSPKTRVLYPLTSLWQSRLALRRADHVVCLNAQDREFLQHRFGIDAARITRVTPGADDVFGEAAAGRQYGQVRRLLFAGSWLPRKGIHELTAAFDALVAGGRALELVVLGAGGPADGIVAAFGHASRDRVRVVSADGDREAAAIMAQADVFVLPSLFEGTPLTLIEAMWSGLPVVTTSTAGMKDVVCHERTGLLVPPADPSALAAAIERLIASEDLRRAIGTAAHTTAREHYTWRRAAAAFEAAYRAAVAA